MAHIHPTATVHPSARIAVSARIGAFSIIEEDVVIGEETVIDTQARIGARTQIGNHTHIHHGVSIGLAPQVLAHEADHASSVLVGDHAIIREFCSIVRGMDADHPTALGNHILLMPYAHVAHGARLEDAVALESFVHLGSDAHIGSGAVIRSLFTVDASRRIGRFADCAYDVRFDIPPFVRSSDDGSFAEVHSEKLREEHFTSSEIEEIETAYNIFYRSGLEAPVAIERLQKEFPTQPHIAEIVSFLKTSGENIMQGKQNGSR